jgi:hypothetical protein
VSDEFKDLSEVELGSEPVETEDFVQADPSLIQPGTYVSQYRRIAARKNPDGNTTFQIEFVGGISNGDTTYQYVPRTWLSTVMWAPRNGQGKTSSVAQYLKALRLPSNLTGDALRDAIAASQDKPIRADIGLQDDPRERQQVPHKRIAGKMVPGPRRAYTRDFNKGSREAPVYVGSIEKDGVTLKAKATVEGFKPIS